VKVKEVQTNIAIYSQALPRIHCQAQSSSQNTHIFQSGHLCHIKNMIRSCHLAHRNHTHARVL